MPHIIPIAQKPNSQEFDNLHLDASGQLKVVCESSLPTGAATSALQTSGNSTLTSLDGKITKGKDATAAGAELQQVLIYGKKDDGTLQPLECLGDRLLVDVVELAASGKITASTALASVQVCGYDDTSTKFKTLNVDSAGQQYVLDQQGRFGMISGINAQTTLGGSITETKQVINCGLDDPVNATKITPMKVDDAGHLQVDVVSMSGGGDASAANQSTMITHLSEIEGAVETIEGCVSNNKVAVELSAGDINIGNVDIVSASGITQLPTTLGQKVNSNSLSVCRSSTVGAFDLSARTTIGTASTSTKLSCDTAGVLNVKSAVNTSSGGYSNTTTIASGALGHTESLSADNTFANVYLMVDTADSGVVEDTYVMVARQNTATSDYFVHTKIVPTGGLGNGPQDIEWIPLTGTTRYYARVFIEKPPEFIAIYNGGFGNNKIAALYNYGLE